MNASTSAATVAKSLPARSLKAGNFVEQQTPKPTQIQDDAERGRSLVVRITSNSIDELEGLVSDLTSGTPETPGISQVRGRARAA